jgi:hypothetical protein
VTAMTTMELVGLLAGLGPYATELPGPGSGSARTCVDAGADVVVAVRAPGPRRLDVQVRRTEAAPGVETWDGLRVGRDGGRHRWTRTVYAGRGTAPDLPPPDRAAAVLGAHGRVWSVEHSAAGGRTAVSWQLHRHSDVATVLAEAGLAAAWAPAAAALDRLHGFPVSGTRGPWSVAVTAAGRVRVGTTRWAWSVDDEAKRHRFARWVTDAGGDGAYAAGLHGLLAGGQRLPVGRAAEIELEGGDVVGVAGYLAIPHADRSPR